MIRVSQLARQRPRIPPARRSTRGYFAIPFIDFRASGGRIYPLLGQPTDFGIFRGTDFEKPDGDLLAVQLPKSFPPYISESDTHVIDRRDQPSIGSAPPVTLVFPLREDGIYAVAREARVRLRR